MVRFRISTSTASGLRTFQHPAKRRSSTNWVGLKTFQHPARRHSWTYQWARCHGVPQTGIIHSALCLHITNMHGITWYRKLDYYTVCCWQQLLQICTVARGGSMGYRKLDYYTVCCWQQLLPICTVARDTVNWIITLYAVGCCY